MPDEQKAVASGNAADVASGKAADVASGKAADVTSGTSADACCDKVVDAVAGVSSEVKALTVVVSRIGTETKKVLDCLVSGATPPDLLTGEKIVPTGATQFFDEKDETQHKLILTLTAGKEAKKRDVEVVFDGVETPEKKSTSAKPSGKEDLTFKLPELWLNDRRPRFVTVNIIDPEPPPSPSPPADPTPPKTPTKRHILPATLQGYDEDDD